PPERQHDRGYLPQRCSRCLSAGMVPGGHRSLRWKRAHGSPLCGLLIPRIPRSRSEEHTSELQSRENLVCRLLLEKKQTHRSTALSTVSARGRHRAPPRPPPFPSTTLFRSSHPSGSMTVDTSLRDAVDAFQRAWCQAVIDRFDGNVRMAAHYAGYSFRGFRD